ncbi:hypothetical protein CEXT_169521 [Caerostris extrusa]|uniref:Uncharacterized protein n=1 Tax=Caerostris extrusa TaxID=172846 RepID=A0AAV4XJR3_CAEEX|nr:hypothetical protein CEXT_169521 [Caerostris extrusa]
MSLEARRIVKNVAMTKENLKKKKRLTASRRIEEKASSSKENQKNVTRIEKNCRTKKDGGKVDNTKEDRGNT